MLCSHLNVIDRYVKEFAVASSIFNIFASKAADMLRQSDSFSGILNNIQCKTARLSETIGKNLRLHRLTDI